MSGRFRAVGVMGAAALVAVFALFSSVNAAPRAATVNVAALDFEFREKTITINVGDTVTWTNEGQAPHNVTDLGGSFESGNMDAGATFSQTFTEAGTFNYLCTYHAPPDGSAGMVGSVVVREVAQQATAAPTVAARPTSAPTITAAQPTSAAQPTMVVQPTSAAPRPTATASGPATLPTTGGENLTPFLLFGVLALLVAGALVARRRGV